MVLLLFWIKITVRRISYLLKHAPVIVIGAMIIIAAFIFAIANKHITLTLDTRTLFIIIPFLVIGSALISLKNYYVMPILITYSKSKLTNKSIYMGFFIKRSFLNNVLLFIFNIISIKLAVNKNHLVLILTATVFSLLLCFLLMYLKNIYISKRISETTVKKLRINPLIKSTLYDYLSSNFLISLLVCIIIFILFIIYIVRDINNIYELKNNSSFFIMITIIFSIGFTSILDSIPNINWKFQAVISPNSVKYHLKRTFLVLIGFFGWLILFFIILGWYIDIMLTIKYLYCIFVMLFATVNISLSINNGMIKVFGLTIITLLTLWVSSLQFYFLPISIIPVIITFIKAKNEYREWSLL